MMRVLSLAAVCALASGQIQLDHDAIAYAKTPVTDAISRLRGAGLKWDEKFGYLPAVLRALDVPVESQIVVFSKTSFQAARIDPKNPRAIYFNDEVSVGYVPGGDVLEIAAHDPKQGMIFYSLDQDATRPAAFVRRDDACLQCHHNGATQDVPGLLIRSIYPEPSGMPLFQAGGFFTDSRSPLEQRWGGWFVTGSGGGAGHMGNAVARDRESPAKLSPIAPPNFANFLTNTSDIAALLVAEHQFRVMNLITRLNYETRLALHHRARMVEFFGSASEETEASTKRRIDRYAKELADALHFRGDLAFKAPVESRGGFAKAFAARGSNRELDLETKLFRAAASYMAQSKAFLALPPEAAAAVARFR
jgi:hypothetical protein